MQILGYDRCLDCGKIKKVSSITIRGPLCEDCKNIRDRYDSFQGFGWIDE